MAESLDETRHTDIYTNCSMTLSECSALNTGRNNKRGRGEERRRKMRKGRRRTQREGKKWKNRPAERREGKEVAKENEGCGERSKESVW